MGSVSGDSGEDLVPNRTVVSGTVRENNAAITEHAAEQSSTSLTGRDRPLGEDAEKQAFQLGSKELHKHRKRRKKRASKSSNGNQNHANGDKERQKFGVR